MTLINGEYRGRLPRIFVEEMSIIYYFAISCQKMTRRPGRRASS